MKAKYSLLTRVEQRFVTIEIKCNPKTKKDEPVPVEGAGSYYARYTDANGNRKYDPLGKDLAEAFAKIQTMEIAKEYSKRGLEVPATIKHEVAGFDDRIAEFIKETKANKSRKTWLAYQNTLAHFRRSCKCLRVQSVTRADLLDFKTYLRDTAKLSQRSTYNNFLNTMIFLKWAGVLRQFDPPVTKGDWPVKPQREPEEYTEEQIIALLNAADSEERLIINSFLCTGLRSGELAHLTYGDIDFKYSIWTVQPKINHTLKTKESQRDVPAPDWLTAKIERRMKAINARREDLIFPSPRKGGVDGHLLRIVKRVAKRAGLHGRIDDHKFRSTAITRWCDDGKSVPNIMKLVGHAKPETLLIYAAKADLRKQKVHRGFTNTFEKFNGVGGD